MRTVKSSWDQSLGQLQELGQLSAAAHGRATSAREVLASTGAASGTRSHQVATHSALQARGKACDAAYLRAAGLLLRRAASDRRPPARMSRPRPVGPSAPSRWVEAIHGSDAIWRSIPEVGPERSLGMQSDHPAVAAVASWAELLGASRQARYVRGSSALYEITESSHASDGRRTPAGLRIRPGMESEARRLHTDRHKVWERARGYGDAVQALLHEWSNNSTG